MPNGLITEDSLRVHPDGFALALTLPWYRSLWLSSVSTIRVAIDGVDVPEADLTLEFGGTRYAIADLPQQRDVPIALDETHDVLVHGELRLPYMQIAPGQDGGPGMYVPNVVHQVLALTV